MKALVLERRGPYAAVLTEEGLFEKIRRECEVGETILVTDEDFQGSEDTAGRKRFGGHRASLSNYAAAAMLAIMIMTGSAFYMTVPVSAHVSLDAGELSVVLEVNRMGRVVGVTALNDASENSAQSLESELKGEKAEDALTDAMVWFEDNEVLSGPESSIVANVTTNSAKQEEALTKAVEEAANALTGSEVVSTRQKAGPLKSSIADAVNKASLAIEDGNIFAQERSPAAKENPVTKDIGASSSSIISKEGQSSGSVHEFETTIPQENGYEEEQEEEIDHITEPEGEVQSAADASDRLKEFPSEEDVLVDYEDVSDTDDKDI